MIYQAILYSTFMIRRLQKMINTYYCHSATFRCQTLEDTKKIMMVAFYIGDEDESCVSQDMIVNEWMPLPMCYEE